MMSDKLWKLISFLLCISGIGSAAVLITHVIIGGILDPQYNQIANSISSLTQTGAPNQEIMQPFLYIYGPLYIIFSVLLVILFRKKTNRIMTAGSVFMVISAVVSTVGFGLFPFEGGDVGLTFQNKIHIGIVITLAVILTVTLILIAAGCIRTLQYHKFGIYLWILASIFTFACGMTIPLVFYDGPFMGLVEKISVGTLQLFVCSLSIYFRKPRFICRNEDDLSLGNEDWV
ncbi:MAG: DUF998 domain-containing protein [Eubacteriales bacterium]